MPVHIGAREARNDFANLLGRVHYGKEVVIVERSGKPMVAVVPLDTYNRLVAEREARFRVLDVIRSRLPGVPPDEVERDVADAIATVRKIGPGAPDAPRRP